MTLRAFFVAFVVLVRFFGRDCVRKETPSLRRIMRLIQFLPHRRFADSTRGIQWAALLIFAALTLSNTAEAFPWMVRHNYASCAVCHVDPSGAGQLTPYGRAQSDVLLRWRPKPPPKGTEVELSSTSNFLWFLEMPEWLNLSGNIRGGALIPTASGSKLRPLYMATDVYATVNFSKFVAHATVGPGFRAAKALIAPACGDGTADPSCLGFQVLAREYWAGFRVAEDTVLIRGGRFNLPFGLRNNEHTSWIRSLTKTDINESQQVGLSVSFNSDTFRGELMGIAGNFQIRPDAYRERGYSAFGEYTLAERLFVGLSSKVTVAAAADDELRVPTTNHAHGLFARWSPVEALALMGEGALLVRQREGQLDNVGFASWLQLDVEFVQGAHIMGTFEAKHEGQGERGPSIGGWLSSAWYVAPHVELRVDGIYSRVTRPSSPEPSNEFKALVQLHLFL
jgi:hypothetical protein